MKIKDVLDSGYVQRYHSNPGLARIGQQNSAHQWGATIILLHFHPEASKALLTYMLTHDVGEYGTADLPGPFKGVLKETAPKVASVLERVERNNRLDMLETGARRFTEVEQTLISLADAFEALDFALRFDPKQVYTENWYKCLVNLVKDCEKLKSSGQINMYKRAVALFNTLESENPGLSRKPASD